MDVTQIVGTPGGALVFSGIAILVSIFWPLYLDKQRDKRAKATDARKELKASYDRILHALPLDNGIHPCRHSSYKQYDDLVTLLRYESLLPGSAIYGNKELGKELNDADKVVKKHRHDLLHTNLKTDGDKQKAVVVAISRLCMFTMGAISNALEHDD